MGKAEYPRPMGDASAYQNLGRGPYKLLTNGTLG
jgi:hypothetical protein